MRHVDRRLRPAFESQLGQQGGHVVLDGLLCQQHLFSDLPVGQAFADELQDPPLLGRQCRQPGIVPFGFGEPLHNPGLDRLVEQGFSVRRAAQSTQQVAAANFLEYVAGRAGDDRSP